MILALLLWQATLNGWTVRGSVIDPADQPIADARVRLTCNRTHAEGRTASNGTFAVIAAGDVPCVLRISHPGFVDTTLPINQQPPGPVTVSMQLATVEERIEVRGGSTLQAAAMGVGMMPLDPEALGAAGPDIARWMMLAGRAAGEPQGRRTLRVNGLSATLPPVVDLVTDISLGGDRFGADAPGGDQLPVDIHAEPSRRFQFSLSPGLIARERRDALLDNTFERTRLRALSAGGMLAKNADLRVFVSGSSHGIKSRPAYLEARGEDDQLTADVITSTRAVTSTGGFAARLGPIDVSSVFTSYQSTSTNAGVGGRNSPAAAIDLDAITRQFDTTWKTTGSTRTMRGGLAIERRRLQTAAISSGAGAVFAGRLLSGTAETIASDRTSASWQLRQIVESSAATGKGWMIGIEASSELLRETRAFNPDGVVLLASASARDGIQARRSGDATLQAHTRHLALFGQRVVVASSHAWARLGVRTDWQQGFGGAIAPLFAGAIRTGNYIVAGNAGSFTDVWSAESELERLFRAEVPVVLSDNERSWPVALEGHGHRRSDVASRIALVRPYRRAIATAEQLLTLGRGLTSLSRRHVGGGFVDTLENDRTLTRAQTRLRLDARIGRWQAAAHYEFAHAEDDAPGTFAQPALQGHLDAERGPSSGIARHAVTLLAFGRVPGGIRVLLSARAASGTSYSLLTGQDTEGLFTFTGRISERRNQQRIAPTSDLSAYAARVFPIPRTRLTAHAGVRLENLLGAVTVLDVERSASSSYAGRPVGTSAGRAVTLWATFGRR